MSSSMGGARTADVTNQFGGPPFRSRFTDAVWQGPTWSFAILLAILRLVESPAGLNRALFVSGFALVMLTTVAALFVRWERLPWWPQALLPAGDLAGAALMVVADPTGAASVVLLCSLPLVWLAFEFGLRGMIGGVVLTTAAAVSSYLRRPEDALVSGPTGVVVSTLFVVGLGATALLMSGILRRIGETLRAQTLEVDHARALGEERLELMTGVMESIDVGVIVWQPDAEPLLNDQARAMTARMGLSPATFEQGASRVFADDCRTHVPVPDQAVSRALAGEEYAGVMQRIGEPGDQRVVVVSARQLTRSEGTRWATVLAAWDATDLVDAIKVREGFLATVSHELRTPLAAIMASMDVLTELAVEAASPDGRDTTRLLAAINRNAGLLKVRIEDLLSSAEPVGVALTPVRTDVTTLVRASLAKHAAHVAAAQVALEEVLEPDLVAEVDATRFEQVVDNLVSNAVKYTAAGGTIVVSLRTDAEHLVLSVADSGRGMSFDEQRQVFERFYRAPRARAEAVQGLGLGLTLVKSIVERHHGTIDLRSTLGEGTTVTVTLRVTAAR